MPGPPPDPNALRRDRASDASTWTDLPIAGRPGEPPTWPLIDPTDRELSLWRTLWAKPQAIEWERLGQDLEVALYVRGLAEAELPDAKVTLCALVARQAHGLGLTTRGLLANRWRITERPPARRTASRKSRARLTVVDEGASTMNEANSHPQSTS